VTRHKPRVAFVESGDSEEFRHLRIEPREHALAAQGGKVFVEVGELPLADAEGNAGVADGELANVVRAEMPRCGIELCRRIIVRPLRGEDFIR